MLPNLIIDYLNLNCPSTMIFKEIQALKFCCVQVKDEKKVFE